MLWVKGLDTARSSTTQAGGPWGAAGCHTLLLLPTSVSGWQIPSPEFALSPSFQQGPVVTQALSLPHRDALEAGQETLLAEVLDAFSEGNCSLLFVFVGL